MWGLLAPTPLGFIPLPYGLTPQGSRYLMRIFYLYGRVTRGTRQAVGSTRRLDSRTRNVILCTQVAQFSMHIWLTIG